MEKDLLYQKVKVQLLEYVKTLAPGQRLPSRVKLASEIGVARSTVERAVSELIGEGHLQARDGSGTYRTGHGAGRGHGLTGGRTWGVIVPDLGHLNIPEVIRSLEDVAREHDVGVLIGNMYEDPGKQRFYIRQFVDRGVDGLAFIPGWHDRTDLDCLRELHGRGVPLVFGIRAVGEIRAPLVAGNSFHAGLLATNHLIAMGFRRIAFLSSAYYSTVRERLQGYLSALECAGRPPEQALMCIRSAENLADSAYEMSRSLLAGDSPPDALFCFNDIMAYAAVRAAGDLGREIGTEIGICGCDNAAGVGESRVRLTSVTFPADKIGRGIGEVLLSGAGDHGVHSYAPRLVVRDSCGENVRASPIGQPLR